jgi:hypothetical protein
MMNEADVVTEFRKRQKEYFNALKPWLYILIAGVILMFIADKFRNNIDNYALPMFILGFIFLGSSIIMFTKKTLTIYRCPKCNAVPSASSGFIGSGGLGFRNWVALSPKQCSKCGAKLK